MSEQITIVIADDHPIVRQGLRQVIDEDRRLQVVGEAANGATALDLVAHHSPDVTILDIDMPEMNGFDAARAIRQQAIKTEIVFLTMHRDEDMFNAALDAGAKGFVLKDSAMTDIIECIKAVAASEYYASHSLTSFLINRTRRAIELTERSPSIKDLTNTELRVLKLIATDMTSKQIGEELFISPRTVEKHRQNICEKLDLSGSHSLFKFAVQNRSMIP